MVGARAATPCSRAIECDTTTRAVIAGATAATMRADGTGGSSMKPLRPSFACFALIASTGAAHAQQITAAGQPAQLDIRAAGPRSIRITLKPVTFEDPFPFHPAVAERSYPRPAVSLRQITKPTASKVGSLNVEVRGNPTTVRVTRASGTLVQEIVFENDGNLSFEVGGQPVLGMGEGGPRPEQGTPWRQQPVQFDRRGKIDTM